MEHCAIHRIFFEVLPEEGFYSVHDMCWEWDGCSVKLFDRDQEGAMIQMANSFEEFSGLRFDIKEYDRAVDESWVQDFFQANVPEALSSEEVGACAKKLVLAHSPPSTRKRTTDAGDEDLQAGGRSKRGKKAGSCNKAASAVEYYRTVEDGDPVDTPFPETELRVVPFQTIPRNFEVCMKHFSSRVYKVNSRFYRKFYLDAGAKDKWGYDIPPTVFAFEDDFFTRNDLSVAYQNVYFAADNKGIIVDPKYRFIDKFLNSPDLVNYEGTENRPPLATSSDPGKRLLNTWKDYRFSARPLNEEELAGSPHVQFFEAYLDSLFGPQDGVRHFLKCNIGLGLDHPEIRQTRMIIMEGDNGNGKSSLGKLLCQVFGSYACCQTINPQRDVFGQFNSVLLFHNVIFLDEVDATTFGKLNKETGKEMDGTSKSTVSNETIDINIKGKTAFTIKSFHLFGPGCTNHKDVIPVGRRYLPVKTLSTLCGKGTYWTAFNKKIKEEEFARHIYWYLVHHSRKFPDWHWDDPVQNEFKITRGLGAQHCTVQFLFWLLEKINNETSLGAPFESAKKLKGKWILVTGADEIHVKGSLVRASVEYYFLKRLPRSGLLAFSSDAIKELVDGYVRSTGMPMFKWINLASFDDHFKNEVNDDKLAAEKNVWTSDGSGFSKDKKKGLLVVDFNKVLKIYEKENPLDEDYEDDEDDEDD
jgi:hypothetical protein